MKKTYNHITELIGHTPILALHRYGAAHDLAATIYAKLEAFNPGGSVKDRIAYGMVQEAEDQGILVPGATIIEPTSGNTGIGLALVGAARGYRVIIVMPGTMSIERRKLMLAYGAELVLSEGAKGMTGAIAKADELAAEIPGAVVLGQFVNPANPATHRQYTGPEIWQDMAGDLDIFVAGVGTGGTVSGVGAYLKEQRADIHIVAIEPADSPVLSAGRSGSHMIQGIGAGFVPETLDQGVYDEVLTVRNEDALATTRQLAKTEGFFAGISSGAALAAATELAKRPEHAGKKILVILPDTGERYLSTALFAGIE